MTSSMVSTGLWENVILLKLYLPQMTSLYVQTVTHGTKVSGTNFGEEPHMYHWYWCKHKLFPEPFSKVPCIFSYVILITIQFVTFVHINISIFCVMFYLSLEATRSFLMVFPPLKWTWTSTLSQMFLKPSSLVYGTTV